MALYHRVIPGHPLDQPLTLRYLVPHIVSMDAASMSNAIIIVSLVIDLTVAFGALWCLVLVPPPQPLGCWPKPGLT